MNKSNIIKVFLSVVTVIIAATIVLYTKFHNQHKMNMVTSTQSEMAIQYAQVIREMATEAAKYPVDYEAESRNGENVNWHLLDEEGYHFEKMDFQNCKGMMLVKDDNIDTDKVVLMLHGGANYQGIEDKYLKMAKNFSVSYQDAKVLVLDFRLAPKNVYPAMQEDVVDAYKTLLDKGYKSKNIVFAGDSAGGGLVLTSVMYLRDHQIELPSAMITLSAITDYTYQGESWTTNADLSPMLGKHMNKDMIKPIFAGTTPLDDPGISALYGNKEGLPRLLMQVASYEAPLSDTLDFAKQAKKAGVDVTEEVYFGLFHVFQISDDLPESKIAWEHIEEFLNN